MKKTLAMILIVLGVAGALRVAKAWTPRRVDSKILKFNMDADDLILGNKVWENSNLQTSDDLYRTAPAAR